MDEVVDWVTNGPPCNRLRGVGPAIMYDDQLANGLRVQHFIGTSPHTSKTRWSPLIYRRRVDINPDAEA